MISSIVSRLVILVFGTLYPAYASYKAVRTKNVKEYVKWMMYWIVFALFTCAETFTDVFLSFWFPFYYEIKIILVLWLLSPATKGSSILYRKFVHPMLSRREQDIDEYIAKAKEQGYHTVLHLGTKGVNYATTVIMQTAIKGGGGLVQQLRRSYSLSDLSTDKDMADVNRNSKALSNIPDDDTDEADEGSIDPRLLRPRGYSPRRSASGSGRVEMYFPEVDVDVRQHTSRQREPSIPLSHIRSSEDVSSGYSSAEPLYAGHHAAKGEGLVPSREPLMRTASVGSTRSVRPKSSRGGVVSKRTPTTEDSERWSNEEAVFQNQEEYTCYISSSLPSQLASIPLAQQSLSQEELLLLLQDIYTLKAQKVGSTESLPFLSGESQSTASEPQLLEIKSEDISNASREPEFKQSTETISENVSEANVSESSVLAVDLNESSLTIQSAVSEYVLGESGIPETKSEASPVVDSSKSSIPNVENVTNSSTEEALDDSEIFVDADTNILSSLQYEPETEVKLEQAVESSHTEDTFVDADTELEGAPLMSDDGSFETVDAALATSAITVDFSGKVEDKVANACDAVHSDTEMEGAPLMSVDGSSETVDAALASAASTSAITVDLVSGNVEDKVANASDDVHLTVSGDSVMKNEDKAEWQGVEGNELQVESQNISSETLIANDESVISTVEKDIELSQQSEPPISLNESVDPSKDSTLCVDESATSDTFADLSITTSDEISESITDDLNASSETLKFSDEIYLSDQPEMPTSSSPVQLSEHIGEASSVGTSEETKDIRSGRYHKRHAPAPPPEQYKEPSAEENRNSNNSNMPVTENEGSVHKQVSEKGDQVITETAVKARLVLQPGIVKAIGPETSDSTSKTEKFISSSPKSKRKSSQRSKSKQKGSAISRLLVMPKNQLEHFASFLPFWGSRDNKNKLPESDCSLDNNAGKEQTSSIPLNQEKEKETIAQPPVSTSTLPSLRKKTIPMSSCSLEYLPYIGGENDFDSNGMDKVKSNSISDFKIREMSHSPPSVRRAGQHQE